VGSGNGARVFKSTISYAHPGKYRIEESAPMHLIQVVDGKTSVTYSPELRQLVRDTSANFADAYVSGVIRAPIKLSGAELQFDESVQLGDKKHNCTVVRASHKGTSDTLWIDKESGLVVKFVTGGADDAVTYILTSSVIDPTLADSLFAEPAPSETQVVQSLCCWDAGGHPAPPSGAVAHN
jgi:outer membrane lipoprotein-sorting protein